MTRDQATQILGERLYRWFVRHDATGPTWAALDEDQRKRFGWAGANFFLETAEHPEIVRALRAPDKEC